VEAVRLQRHRQRQWHTLCSPSRPSRSTHTLEYSPILLPIPYHTAAAPTVACTLGLAWPPQSVRPTPRAVVYCAQHGRPHVYCGTTGSVTV
jgi:hypothetical protein